MTAPLRIYAPASIGNVAAGFDLLGAALAPLDGSLLGDILRIEPAAEDGFRLEGPFASRLPGDPRSNLVCCAWELFKARARAQGLALPGAWTLTLEKRLPVSSGLGSSASSVVAALRALQAVCGSPFDGMELLEMAGLAEGSRSGAAHLDNVAPSLLGGLRLVVPGRDGHPSARELPWPRDLVFAVVHPECELATAQSRALLPPAVALGAAVEFAGNLAAFVHALHTGDRGLLARCLRDPLAEPHRAPSIPGFAAAKAGALAAGALGCSLSGSGPSVFAVTEESRAGAVAAAMAAGFLEAGLASQTWLCGLDTRGARIL